MDHNMLKNLSASLIAATQGVMKQPVAERAAPAEDQTMMEAVMQALHEGEVSAGTVARRKVANVGRPDSKDILAKEGEQKAKIAEDVEAIAELSKNALSNYMDNAAAHADIHASKAAVAKKGSITKAFHDKQALKREIGWAKADKKLNTEEVEVINELGDATLGSYRTKAKAQVDALSHKKGKKKASEVKMKTNREAGLNKAFKTLSDRREKAYNAFQHHDNALYNAAVPGVAKKLGFNHVHSTAKSHLYMKHEPETNTITTMKHVPAGDHSHTPQVHITDSAGSTTHHSKDWRTPTGGGHTDHAKSLEDTVRRHLGNKSSWHQPGIHEAFEAEGTLAVLRETHSFGDIVSITEGDETLVALHPTHLEEIAGLNEGEEVTIKDQNGKSVVVSIDEGFLMIEDTDGSIVLMDRSDLIEQVEPEAATKTLAAKVIEEARGRPAKASDEEETTGAGQNIIAQLRKAADSGLKPVHVSFEDGSKHPVSRSQARAVIAKHNSLKPAEKAELQTAIAKSHENLLKHA